MARPDRRGENFTEAPYSAPDDNGADGIDWETGTLTPTELTVEESDGTPSAVPVDTIKLDAADFTLVDNADGSVSVTTDEPDAAAHIADTTDAHDASAVSFDPTGLSHVTATEVQGAIEELDAAVGTGGGGVIVEDEGTPLTTTATTLDFVGAGVTATGSGATKTITIPGGGGGGSSTGARYPVQEKASGGASAGSHAVTLSATPNTSNVLILVSDKEGAQDISSITQTNVTWTLLAKSGAGVAPVVEIWKGVYGGSGTPGTGVTATYSGSSSFGAIVVSEWTGLTGTLDGSATTHTTTGTLTQPVPLLTPTVATALVIAVICQGGFGTTYQAEYWSGSPLTMFQSSKNNSGNNIQGSYWGFPGATTVYGYGRNSNTNTTQSALTVSIT